MNKENIMSYKIYICVIITFLCTYILSSINFNNFFKKNKELEAKIFVVLISLALSYLVTNFIVNFIEWSQIL